LRRSARGSDRSGWPAAAVSMSRQSVQKSRYLLASCCDQRSVATRRIERVTGLIHGPLRERHSPLLADRTPVSTVQLSKVYLSFLTSVFDVCVCEGRACRTKDHQAPPNMDSSNMEGSQASGMENNERPCFQVRFSKAGYDRISNVCRAEKCPRVLQAIELFATQNTCQKELNERAPDLIVLPIDHTEVGFYFRRTRNDSCDATAKLHQLRNAHPCRGPAICEAHYAGYFQPLHASSSAVDCALELLQLPFKVCVELLTATKRKKTRTRREG
jgi:hypothetical protein